MHPEPAAGNVRKRWRWSKSQPPFFHQGPAHRENLVLRSLEHQSRQEDTFDLGEVEEFFRLLPQRVDSERSWTITRQEIEAKNYDIKAVNPNAKSNEDTRVPEELLDLIEAKGREVAEALAVLRRAKS